MERNDEIRQTMHELGRALSEAITESSDVGRSLRRLRDEGYSLYLLLGTTGDACRTCREAVPVEAARRPEPAAAAAERAVKGSTAAEPDFRIDGRDLAFLRSIGIDPTRRRRGRRRDG